MKRLTPMLPVILLLAACTIMPVSPATQAPATLAATTSAPATAAAETPEATTRAEVLPAPGVWRVEPALEYEHVYIDNAYVGHTAWGSQWEYCQELDTTTGEINGQHDGHGGGAPLYLVWDGERDAWGTDNGYYIMVIQPDEIHPNWKRGFLPVAQGTYNVQPEDYMDEMVINGHWAMMFDYDYISSFEYDQAACHQNRDNQQVAYVWQDGKMAFIGPDGVLLSDFLFDEGDDYPGGDLIAVKIDGLWGFADPTGEVVIPCVYQHAIGIDAGTAFVKWRGMYGILDLVATVGN